MKLDRLADRGGARPQIPPLGNGLLHAVLAEAGLAGDRDRRPNLVGRKSLGDGHELDLIRRPAAVPRPSRDLFTQREKPRDGFRIACIQRLRQSQLRGGREFRRDIPICATATTQACARLSREAGACGAEGGLAKSFASPCTAK